MVKVNAGIIFLKCYANRGKHNGEINEIFKYNQGKIYRASKPLYRTYRNQRKNGNLSCEKHRKVPGTVNKRL